MTRPTDSDSVARLLGEHPPTLDEVARDRIERGLVDAAAARSAGAPEKRARSLGPWVAGGGLLAAAAAIAIGVFAGGPPGSAAGLHAEFQTYDETTRQSGTLEVGSTLRTDG